MIGIVTLSDTLPLSETPVPIRADRREWSIPCGEAQQTRNSLVTPSADND